MVLLERVPAGEPGTWRLCEANDVARRRLGIAADAPLDLAELGPPREGPSLEELLAAAANGDAVVRSVETQRGGVLLETTRLGDRSLALTWRLREDGPDQAAIIERQLLGAREVAGLGSYAWNVASDRAVWSPSLYRIFGVDPAAGQPRLDTYLDRIHPDDRQRVRAELDRALAERNALRHPTRIVRPDGQVRVLDVWGHVLTDSRGAPSYVVGVVLDATGRERLMLSLHQRLRELSVLHDTARLLQDQSLAPRALLARLVEILPSAWPNPSTTEARIRFGRDSVESRGFGRFEGKPTRAQFAISDDTAGELVVVAEDAHAPSMDFDPAKLLGSIAEMLRESFERQRVTRHLDQSNQRLDLALEVADLGLVDWDVEGDRLMLDRRCREILGLPEDDAEYARDLLDRLVHPDDLEGLCDAYRRHAADDTDELEDEHRILLGEGAERWVSTRARIVERAGDGAAERLVGIVQDMTARRLASEEREGLERRLRQAEKMESIGRLAAGIAHDFNNLLTVIDGYGELLSIGVGEDPSHKKYVDGIREASARAARMTRQLLTFSRNQLVRFEIVDLGRTLDSTRQILSALLPEIIDLTITVDDRLWRICADPTQVEQVLINLALNARDAMTEGGRLAIILHNERLTKGRALGDAELESGDYVCLRVDDTGAGMNEEVRTRLFEPFFTTKRAGQGTGLGLSTVYGIVKQCGGAIAVDSAPGAGTRFTILLPRARGEAASGAPSGAIALPVMAPARVLLVEDDSLVRTMVATALSERGHRVFETQNPREALARLSGIGEIDLLLTDVILPQMSGVDLAVKVERVHPKIKVLFISGYPDQAICTEQTLDETHDLLAKPFSVAELIRRVQKLLDHGKPDKVTQAGDRFQKRRERS
jgi:PAS domain S-box-containing protein